MPKPDLLEAFRPVSSEVAQLYAKDPLTTGYQACSVVEGTFWAAADLSSLRGARDEVSCYCYGPDALTWTDYWTFIAPAKYSPNKTLYLGIEMLDKANGELDLAQARLIVFARPFEQFLTAKYFGRRMGLEMLATDHLRNTAEGIKPKDNASDLSVEVYNFRTQVILGRYDRTYNRAPLTAQTIQV